MTPNQVIGVAALAFFTACGAPPGGNDGGSDAGQTYASGSTCPTASTLTEANFGRAFFDTYCQRCHGSTVTAGARNGAPANRTWDTVADIRIHAERIDSVAAGGPTQVSTIMPPTAPMPSEADRKKLGEWLACGAP